MDGTPVPIQSIDDKQIVVTIPGTTEPGTHVIQVAVGGVTGPLVLLNIGTNVAITSATLSSGTITITGSIFGTDAQEIVVINKASGMVGSDSIVSWSDTQIVATSSAAAVGDTVTVTTPYGSATATIEPGYVPPSVTVTIPNGGEAWRRGTTQVITWSKVGVTGDTVTIQTTYINSKGKTITTTIATGVTNSGSYSWNIPRTQVVDNDYKVIVTTSGGQSDTSDNYFSITR
jgi:hypothetical protein